MATTRRSRVSRGDRTKLPTRTARTSGSGPVRVWSGCSLTIAVTDDPPQFIKVEFGFEKMAPNDSDAAIKRTEQHIYTISEEIVEKRSRKMARMIRRINREL
jgi:hypothetical protein